MDGEDATVPGGSLTASTAARWRWLAVAIGMLFGAAPPGVVAATDGKSESAVERVFADFARRGDPGCSVGVMRDGALLHASGHGLADIATGKPLDARSVFNIASISKQFTAFSILLLAERKALSLDDPLIKHVPELTASAPQVKLRHLLHHMGGLRDYEALLMLRGRRLSDGATQFETIHESAWEQVGDGQVHTTVGDLLLWADNLRTARVGGPALVKRMVEVGVLDSGERINYAAGLVVDEYNGLSTVGHSGGWAGYASNLLMFPQQQLSIAVLCNRNDQRPGRFAQSVAELYLENEMRLSGKRSSVAEESNEGEPPATRWRPKSLAAYAGVYVSDEAEARCVLVQQGGQLIAEGCLPGMTLQPTEQEEFYVAPLRARLRFQERAGKPAGFTLHAYGLDGLAFTRQ